MWGGGCEGWWPLLQEWWHREWGSTLPPQTQPPPLSRRCRYPVRMALIDLDNVPSWFSKQAGDHMTAAQARAFAGTDGERRRHPPALPPPTPAHPRQAGSSADPLSQRPCRQFAHAPALQERTMLGGPRPRGSHVRPTCSSSRHPPTGQLGQPRPPRRQGVAADAPHERRLPAKPHQRLLLPPRRWRQGGESHC